MFAKRPNHTIIPTYVANQNANTSGTLTIIQNKPESPNDKMNYLDVLQSWMGYYFRKDKDSHKTHIFWTQIRIMKFNISAAKGIVSRGRDEYFFLLSNLENPLSNPLQRP